MPVKSRVAIGVLGSLCAHAAFAQSLPPSVTYGPVRVAVPVLGSGILIALALLLAAAGVWLLRKDRAGRLVSLGVLLLSGTVLGLSVLTEVLAAGERYGCEPGDYGHRSRRLLGHPHPECRSPGLPAARCGGPGQLRGGRHPAARGVLFPDVLLQGEMNAGCGLPGELREAPRHGAVHHRQAGTGGQRIVLQDRASGIGEDEGPRRAGQRLQCL